MNSRKQIKLFLYLNVTFLFLIGLINYIVDPFTLFHQPIWKKPTFSVRQVFTNLGQIDTYLKNTDQYDCILIGTSHALNFSGKEVSKALEAKGTLKLCLYSGHPVEFEAIANRAFRSTKVKKVLWGFELMHFFLPAYTPYHKRVFPYEWYNSSFKKYNLLLNPTTCSETALSLIYHLSNYRLFAHRLFKTGLDNIYYHNTLPAIKKKHLHFFSKAKLKVLKNKNQIFKTFNPFSGHKTFSAIDIHFIPLIENHPEIDFYVLLVPYSSVYFTELDQQQYQDILACQRYLIEKCSVYSNVKFYAFHTCKFPYNLANYHDTTHYHSDINRYMLYAIQNDQHRLTLSNLDVYEKAMIENLKNFEVQDAYPQEDTFEDIIKNEVQSHLKQDDIN